MATHLPSTLTLDWFAGEEEHFWMGCQISVESVNLLV